jgi:hypothetical protein
VQAQLLLCLFLDLLFFFFFSCLCHFLPFAHTGRPVRVPGACKLGSAVRAPEQGGGRAGIRCLVIKRNLGYGALGGECELRCTQIAGG